MSSSSEPLAEDPTEQGNPPLPPTELFVASGVANEAILETLPLSVAPPTLPSDPGGAVLIPGYQILEELGRGGMGVVYKAWQVPLKRLVALKMILAGAHAGAADLARFRSEAEAIARLPHPHIVQIFEVGEQGGLPYFSLEFCPGGNLARKLNGTPLQPREAADLVEKLARAMQAAHDKGVIHRDLKPGNVLLAADGTPKITDFGLAKVESVARPGEEHENGLTMTGAVVGTPSYMAPEQAGGTSKQVGPAADVYALGAILYESLTGRPPFCGPTPVDTVYQVLYEEPVSPRHLQPKTPRDLETICLKCLHKVSTRRYASAAELADDLRRFQAGEPIRARPVGRLERCWRWCRRNPRLASLTAAVVFLLVLMAGGSMFAALLLQGERDQVLAHQVELKKTNTHLRQAREEEADARRDALEELWKSYLAQARAGRWSGQAGRRYDGLAALTRAAAHRPSLELRNEAIACMALVDVRIGKEWDGYPPGTVYLAFDRSLSRYARCDEHGNLSVRLVEDDTEIANLPGPGSRAWLLHFDRSNRYLVGKFHPPGADGANQVILWDLQSGKRILEITHSLGNVAFSPDDQLLAVAYPDLSIRMFEVSSGKETGKRLTAGPDAHGLSFHPTNPWLAVSSRSGGGVRILETTTGRVLKHLAPGKSIRGIAWHPHGRLLAGAGGDARVYLWDAESGVVRAALEGHRNAVTSVAFDHTGSLLASLGWENMMWLWDPWGGKLLLRVTGVTMHLPAPVFSADGRYLGYTIQGRKIRLWEVARAAELRTLYPGTHVINREVGLGPGGSYLACPETDGTRIWDVHQHRLAAHLPGSQVYSAFFRPDGSSLITSGTSGLQSWPVTRVEKGPESELKVGPARLLGEDRHVYAALSQDGRFLVAQSGPTTTRAVDLEHLDRTVLLRDQPSLRYLAVSLQGKYAATGPWRATEVKIWDARSGNLLHTLPCRANALVAFSPDGQGLIVCSDRDARWYQVGSWQPGPWLYQNRDLDIPSYVAFSPQGDLLAINDPLNQVRLLDPATGKELATLEPLDQQNISWLGFDARGSHLAVATDTFVQVWDLELIRERLKEMKLSWRQ
jgi:WD40 repeat protein